MSGQVIGRPMEILLVEDGLLDARLAIVALKRSGLIHRLTLLRDGAEALAFLHRAGKFARAPRPDLILLDLLLPKLNGFEVLADLRADDTLREIPVVILTAADDEDFPARAELYDVEHFIRKPVNFGKFLETVRKLRSYWHQDLTLPSLD